MASLERWTSLSSTPPWPQDGAKSQWKRNRRAHASMHMLVYCNNVGCLQASSLKQLPSSEESPERRSITKKDILVSSETWREERTRRLFSDGSCVRGRTSSRTRSNCPWSAKRGSEDGNLNLSETSLWPPTQTVAMATSICCRARPLLREKLLYYHVNVFFILSLTVFFYLCWRKIVVTNTLEIL